MLSIGYLTQSHHIEGFPVILPGIREKFMRFVEGMILELENSDNLTRDSEHFLMNALLLRIEIIQELGPLFMEKYLPTITDQIAVSYNFNENRGLEIFLNALDLLFRVGVGAIQVINEQFSIKDSPYFKDFLESSLRLEIGLILSDYCLNNKKQNPQVFEFLRLWYERYGAYAVLSGLWDIKEEEDREPYFKNIEIVTRAIRLNSKYPHLNATNLSK